MKKILQWVMAATLICGASVFTSCTTNDTSDNPSQEQAKKNRKEFIEHTRQNLKTLAENLNFSSWEEANLLNMYFNKNVLNNPEFTKSVLAAFIQKTTQTFQPVEEGSELAAKGYTMYGIVDLTEFNYRFTMNADGTAFDMEEAEDFEVIMNGMNPLTKQVEPGIYKVTLKAGGETSFKTLIPSPQTEGLALVLIVPSDFQFAISQKITGTWADAFFGSFKNYIATQADTEFASLKHDSWSVSGTLNSVIPADLVMRLDGDVTTLNFSVISDRVNYKGYATVDLVQNGNKLINLSLKESGDGSGGLTNLDLSEFSNSASIFDVLAAIMTSRVLDEGTITLLDDLTTTISISDMEKAIQIVREGSAARRNYADQQTIDKYTQQLNDLMTCTMTCKAVNQTIPMRMMTTKFGVDWWSMPSFNFADENGYVSLVDLIDPESVTYGINILDHAAEPMQQSLIVVRQLIQYVRSLTEILNQTQTQPQPQS